MAMAIGLMGLGLIALVVGGESLAIPLGIGAVRSLRTPEQPPENS